VFFYINTLTSKFVDKKHVFLVRILSVVVGRGQRGNHSTGADFLGGESILVDHSFFQVTNSNNRRIPDSIQIPFQQENFDKWDRFCRSLKGPT